MVLLRLRKLRESDRGAVDANIATNRVAEAAVTFRNDASPLSRSEVVDPASFRFDDSKRKSGQALSPIGC